MADLAEGWLLHQRGDPAAAYAHASKHLARNDAWPAAHFLAGQACSAMAHMPASQSEVCSITRALDHLLKAAATPGDKHWGSSRSSKAKRSKAKAAAAKTKSKVAGVTPEPPLPPAIRFQACQLWLALAAHNGLNSSDEFAAVVEKALQLDPGNGSWFKICTSESTRLKGAIRLVWASSMPHNYAAASANTSLSAWSSFKSRMSTALGNENMSRVNSLSATIPTGSVALDDPLLVAAYSHQFYHAYAPPHTTRNGMELFGQVLRRSLGLNSDESSHYVAGFELDWRPPIEEWKQSKARYRAAATASSSSAYTTASASGSGLSSNNNLFPPSSPPSPPPSSPPLSPARPRLCFVSSFLYGGHQLVRIFDEVARRLPAKGWDVSVAHLGVAFHWDAKNGLLRDERNRQRMWDSRIEIITLPRSGALDTHTPPLEAYPSHAPTPLSSSTSHHQPWPPPETQARRVKHATSSDSAAAAFSPLTQGPSRSGSDILSPALEAWLARSRATLWSRRFDVIVFTDLGMDLSAYLLAHSRLAVGAQLVAWGHPVTSGLPGPFSKHLPNPISSKARYRPSHVFGSEGSQVVKNLVGTASVDTPPSFAIDGFVMHEASVAGGCWAHHALNRTANDENIDLSTSGDSTGTSTSSTSGKRNKSSGGSAGSSITGSCTCKLKEAKALVQRDFTEQLYWLPSHSDREYRLSHVHWRSDLPSDRYGRAPVECSAVNGLPISSQAEVWGSFNLTESSRLVVLLNAPHKVHPDTDALLADIALADPSIVLLVLAGNEPSNNVVPREVQRAAPNPELVSILKERFVERAGVPLSQLRFTGFLPHHRLLASFRYAALALDPLYFGGDGTTREALEMGCPVVSLPSRGLGSRWTASLYSLLGIPPSHHDDEHCSESSDSMDSSAESHSSGQGAHTMWPFEISSLEAAEHAHIDSPRVKLNAQAAEEHESKDKGSRAKASMLRGIAPVATSKEEYVRMALALASDSGGIATRLKRLTLARAPTHLFRREDAVEAWDNLLRRAVADQYNGTSHPFGLCDEDDASSEAKISDVVVVETTNNGPDIVNSIAAPSTESSMLEVSPDTDGTADDASDIEAIDAVMPKPTSTLMSSSEASLGGDAALISTDKLYQPRSSEPLKASKPEVPLAPAGYWSEAPPELPRPYRSSFPYEAYDDIVHSDRSSSSFLWLGSSSNDLSDGLSDLLSSSHGNSVLLLFAFVLFAVAASAFAFGRWMGFREGHASQSKTRSTLKGGRKEVQPKKVN